MEQRGGRLGLATLKASEMAGCGGGIYALRSARHGGRTAADGGAQEIMRAYRKTPQVAAHGEEQAKRWLADGLKAAGLMAKDLSALKGSDLRKLALA